MLGLIWIIIIGAVVGALAKVLTPGSESGGFFMTAILGMVGALIATLLGRFIGLYGSNQGAGFIASILGAVLVLWVYRRMGRGEPRAWWLRHMTTNCNTDERGDAWAFWMNCSAAEHASESTPTS
jgi:uncharacterized membrane protein YeaQ/YmgE (transglycosylase-associated protein family)